MGYRNITFTFVVSGDPNGAPDAIDIFLAGVRLKMWYLSGEAESDTSGPEAPDAPAINVPIDGNCSITTPNFNPVEGVTYVLEYSDNEWASVSVLDSDCGPNETTETTFTSTRRWRITAYDNTGTVNGQSTALIP